MGEVKYVENDSNLKFSTAQYEGRALDSERTRSCGGEAAQGERSGYIEDTREPQMQTPRKKLVRYFQVHVLTLLLCCDLVGHAAAPESKAPNAEKNTLSATFKLTKGKGVKVCEAYLTRLNRSAYEYFPTCDRPENDQIAGFERLNRVFLKPEEIQPFWASAMFLLSRGDPNAWRQVEQANKKLGLPQQYGDRDIELRAIQGDSYLKVYRYDPPVDIDNDGKPDPVVVWRYGPCALTVDSRVRFWEQVPLVLNLDGTAPDATLTRRNFAHPVDGYRPPSGVLNDKFRAIGPNMSFFRFEEKYYFDAFFDVWGDFQNQRRKDPEIINRLGVFLNDRGNTRQVCEYWLEDFVTWGGTSMRKYKAIREQEMRKR